MSRVVFIADCLVTQSAGIHYYAFQFIKRFVDLYPAIEVSIIVPERFDKLNVKQIIVPIRKDIPLHYRLRYFTSIPKAVRQISPDLVIEMAHFGPFRIGKKMLTATVIHDLTPVHHPDFHDRASVYAQKLFLPGIIRHSDFIIVNSMTTKSDVMAYADVSPGKIIISHPVLLPELTVLNDKASVDKEEYIVSVGTIEPRKNYITIVKAFEKASTHFPELKYYIVGKKGWKYHDLLDYIDQSPYRERIILKGYLDNDALNALISKAKLFIQGSIYEGFGIPVLFAFKYGIPVLCSDIPALREVGHSAAQYFDPLNVDDCFEKMSTIIKDRSLGEEMAQLSLRRFTEFNTWDLGIEKIIKRLKKGFDQADGHVHL